jgi:hypothetical protein
VAVHLIRRDDKAGAYLPDFMPFGGIKADEEDIETRRYHVHSF